MPFMQNPGGKPTRRAAKPGDTYTVIALSGRESEAGEVAKRIDQDQNLGRQAATPTPDSLHFVAKPQ
jgi:hypothetical protein